MAKGTFSSLSSRIRSYGGKSIFLSAVMAIGILIIGGGCAGKSRFDESKYEKIYEGQSIEQLQEMIRNNPDNLEAITQLAREYMDLGWSDETQKDHYWKLGFDNFMKAAQKGHVVAQYDVGVNYVTGWGVEKDEKKAYEWWTRSAQEGYPSAEAAIGKCYFNGWGVEKNDEEACRWWKKAAEANDLDGMIALAYSYFNGTGVTKDDKKGLYWAQKAADKGDDSALQYYKYVVIGEDD